MRCGCNDEAVVVEAGRGIDVTEKQENTLTRYTVSVDGSTVAGNGLLWDPQTRRFQVRLGATNPGLAFDGTGGLYNTRSGTDPGPTPTTGASVAALEARAAQQDVVAGIWGSGYMIKPYNTRAAFEYGVQRGIDAMHVPVRFLYDGTPVVAAYEQAERGTLAGGHVQEQDIQRWRLMTNEPGVWYPLPNKPAPTTPQQGWFGYMERNESGLLSLAEVFDIVGHSAVLLIELAFPAFDRGQMVWDHSTPNSRVDRFLDRVRVLIQRYSLTESVVVLTNTPQVPNGTAKGRPVLDGFTNASIRTGPILLSAADAAAYPPGENWPPAWTWAVLNQALPDSTIQGYTQQGTKCLLTTMNRQYLHDTRTVPNGALGALSADPEYYAGQFETHPTAASHAYRKTGSTWNFTTVDPGLLPPSDAVDHADCHYRALYERSDGNFPGALVLGNRAFFSDSPYYVLQGWMCPITPATYTISVKIAPDWMPEGGYACMAFGVNTDHAFRNFAGAPDYSGYIFVYDVNRTMSLHSWDSQQGKIVQRGSADASGNTNDPKLFNIVVSPTALRVQFLPGGGASPVEIPSDPTADWATQWRGGYTYLGRYSPGDNTAAKNKPVMFYDLKLENFAAFDDNDRGQFFDLSDT